MSVADILNRCDSMLDKYGKYDEVEREKPESSKDPFGVLYEQIKGDIRALQEKVMVQIHPID